MLTNLAIDDDLVEEAKKIGNHKAAVIEALREYIQIRKQLEITRVFNSIDYLESYNYKQQRRKT
jgi:hypothetical protein